MAAAPHAPCTRRHALLIAAGMAVASVARARARLPVRHTVVMAATAYAPLTLTVRRGDSVEWINKDPFRTPSPALACSIRRASPKARAGLIVPTGAAALPTPAPSTPT